jgi:hypothetical protein
MTKTLSDEQYEQLRQDLKTEVVAEVKQDIHEELSTLTTSENEVEVRSDEDNPALTDIWLAGIPMGKLLDKALQNSRKVGSSASEPTDEGEETTLHRPEMPPIERLAEAENYKDATMGYVTESVERATVIYKHFREWSSKAPKGRVIKNNLKNLLNTATNENLSWKQVYRACRKLEEWSKGAITFKKHNKFGWMLVDGRPSSVGNG